MSVRRYRWHHCDQRHLSGRSFAKCAFPSDVAVRGIGQWAVVTFCAVRSVSLSGSRVSAVIELERVDAEGCSAGCSLQHQLAYLDLSKAQTAPAFGRPGDVA